MSFPSTFECFGLVIHGYGAEDVFRRVDQNISEGHQTMIVTANPEILLEAKQNTVYWNALRQADMRVADGVALKFAGWACGVNVKRLPGVQLAEYLLQKAVQRNWRVALIGGDPDNADRAAREIQNAYPGISLFAERGGIIQADGSDDDVTQNMLFRLTQFAPDVLLVGFGHPKQELWLSHRLQELPSVKVAVGVGGTIDYWSGTKQRAPRFMQTLGFEWLWRLIQEPTRHMRIFRAVFVFPFAFVWSKIVG